MFCMFDSAAEGVQLGIMILAVVALLLCFFLGAFALIPSGIFLFVYHLIKNKSNLTELL